MLNRYNGAEIAPCIISKCKFALDLIESKPTNCKCCSQVYWNEVVDILSEENKIIDSEKIEIAKKRYDILANYKTLCKNK